MCRAIKLQELLKLPNPYIIDVREEYEFELGSIPKAINIPVRDLLDNYQDYLNFNQTYYIYCQTNVRSSKVCEFLSSLGYNVVLVEGGYEEWLSINKKK